MIVELDEEMRVGRPHVRGQMVVLVFKERPANRVQDQQDNVAVALLALSLWHIENAVALIGDPWERGYVGVVPFEA